ncbi:MAG: type II CRISPR RNA-guided endonuclease Cas9, partial [Treponema sp.]|nr:type II CRISPR RNA-guided endonuclease Cas9 [Treponema sp.]
MNYRLGLDLGTNSIGWAVYSLDNGNESCELVDMGVRIFSDGRDPKTKEPLAVARRIARGQRKLIYRRKLRRRAMFRLLQEQGLFPAGKDEARKLKLLNPYQLRIKALDEKLEPHELARVLFNLSVRRGFKSNRKDATDKDEPVASKSGEKLSQADMSNELSKSVKDSGCRTLGEFLWKNQDKNHGIRFVPGRMSYYPLRQMYVDEFNAIRAVQEPFYKTLDWDALYDAVFFQRPLKPQERGKCQYMADKERTFKAMPCSQRLRMLQEIRNMDYQNERGQKIPLSEDDEKTLVALLDTKDKVTFDAFRKAMKLSPACTFNLESESRTSLNGNSTAVKLRSKNRFGELWDTLPLEEQDAIVEKLIMADEDKEIFDMLAKYPLSDEQKESVVKVQLPTGTTMLCREVSERLVHKMEELGCNYTTAKQVLGYNDDQSVEKYDLLPYYGKVLVGSTMGGNPSEPEDKPERRYGKISNPTVHVALNQTRTVVNALIKEYGRPAQVAVELSRDLKASRDAKDAMVRKQNENRKRNEILNKNIREGYGISYPNRNDRLKFRLWEELGASGLPRRCLYCGKTISGAELFTKNIEIEHILPYSRTLLDAESNLTVAHASCNAFKKERSPYEAFGSSPAGYSWARILERANQLRNPVKRGRFAVDAMESFEKDSGFITRQLTDNAYLSKMAFRYLHSVCDKVWTVNGGMTKLLRDKWEIDSILKRRIDDKEIAHFELKEEQIGEYKKNRYDHRHHALDASVIALIDPSLVREISTLNARSQKNRIEVPPMAVPRMELQEKVRHIVVSFKPDHGAEGKLSKETLLGKIKREEAVDIAKLEEKDIPLIKHEKVRTDFERELAGTKDIKLVRKALKDIYPQVKLYREYFVARGPIT